MILSITCKQLREGRQIPTRIQHLPPPEDIPPHLAAAEMAYVRRGDKGGPLAQPYAGPYKITHKGPKTFTLDMGGKEKEVSVDRLKPHTGAAAATKRRAVCMVLALGRGSNVVI